MKTILVNKNKGEKPTIELKVQRVEPSVWKTLGFYKHHYLTANLNKSCKCLLFSWGDEPVAFVGILNTPRLGIPYGCSISRIVVLPQYQGIGLFGKIMKFCGGIIKSLSDGEHDYKLYIKSAHEKVGMSLNNKPDWRGTQFDGKTRTVESTKSEGARYKNRLTRKSYCKEYIGEKLDGYKDILLPISDMRKLKENNGMKDLFDM